MHDVVIVGAQRTPLGAFQGCFKDVSAHQLGSYAIQGALQHSRVTPEQVDTVLMGCVLTAGLGQAPARQAALGAKLPLNVHTTTVGKVCGSGLQALMFGVDMIRAGSARVVIAGGMESMSQAPYLLPKVRKGLRFGHHQMLDHMLLDGLEDAYSGQSMGLLAEQTASEYGFSRDKQDAFVMETCQRAQKALQNNIFSEEMIPIMMKDTCFQHDEPPGKIVLDKIPSLKPAFLKDGTITAASSSGLCDGAASVVLMSQKDAERLGFKPLARVVAHATYAQEPARFTTAPVGAIRQVLDKATWRAEDVDLYEINEAFAVVTMAAMKDMNLSHERVNIHGGACALGHPIGASGARLVVTLLHALHHTGARTGVASLCIGGGEGVAMALERL